MTPTLAEHERDIAKGREHFWRFKIAQLRNRLNRIGSGSLPLLSQEPINRTEPRQPQSGSVHPSGNRP